jgi:hypothetical protein
VALSQEPTNGVASSQKIDKVTVHIGNKEYQGYLHPDSDYLEMSADDGEKLDVFVLPLGDDKDIYDDKSVQKYPHLLHGRQIKDSEIKRIYDCYQVIKPESYITIENALFENRGISLIQRIILSLSLSAAMHELEEYLGSDKLCGFDLDSILVEKNTYSVLVDLKSVVHSQMRRDFAKKAYIHGVLPPECYESGEFQQLGVLELRHMLAVLIFRSLTAADPFDGLQTLTEYPYRSENSLKQIYGNQAEFVYGNGNKNKTNYCIGKNVELIFSRICPRLKCIFDEALRMNILSPENRPNAEQWVNNQKKMLEWMSVTDKGWLIPDLESGYGTNDLSVQYCCLENGVIIPVENNKPILQYMLEPQNEPLNERIIGSLVVQCNCLELVFRDPKKKKLILQGTKFAVGAMTGWLMGEPWNQKLSSERQKI